MNTSRSVAALIDQWKASGAEAWRVAWSAALLCVDWPYVFGAWGEFCTPANRKRRARTDHPTIISKCQVLSGKTKSCSGCRWYPGGETVRCFDCRGFTDWCLKQAGIDLKGEGATSQWNNSSNWLRKGDIATMPENTLVCLFVKKGSKMEHTGFGLNEQTIECSSGVQHFTERNKKWTHWGVPACVGGAEPVPEPEKGTAIVTGKKVALREDQSTRATIIMRINTGETVKLLPEPDLWDYVEYKGKKGWMMREFLKEG